MVTATKAVALSALVVGTCGAALFYGQNLYSPNASWRETKNQVESKAAAADSKADTRGNTETRASPGQSASAVPNVPATAAAEGAGNDAAPQTQTEAGRPASSASRASDQREPHFDVARVDKDGSAVIAGRATPGAKVDLLRNGEVQDSAVADSSGEFVMTETQLPPGSYKLTLRSTLPDGAVTQSQSSVSVAVNESATLPPRVASAHADIAKVEKDTTVKEATRSKEQSPTSPHNALHVAAVPPTEKGSLHAREPASPSTSSQVVSRGDSLWRISRKAYGEGTNYALIYRANRDKIRNPNLIYPGQTFVLPGKRQ